MKQKQYSTKNRWPAIGTAIAAAISIHATAGCKARQGLGTTDKLKNATFNSDNGHQNELFVPETLPERLPESKGVVWYRPQVFDPDLIGTPDSAQAAHKPGKFVQSQFACWRQCDVKRDSGTVGMNCSIKGAANISVLATKAANWGPKEKEIFASIFHRSVTPVDTNDKASKAALDTVLAEFLPGPGVDTCEDKRDGTESLGLADLVGRRVVFRNNSGKDLVLTMRLKYEATDGYVYQSEWLYLNYSNGQDSSINWNGVRTFYGITYRADAGGQLIQDNGNGVNFISGTDDYVIDLTAGSGGGVDLSGGSGSVATCKGILRNVYNYYPTSSFQGGDKSGEISRCHTAAASFDWNPVMTEFYCNLPGVPERQCFSIGAGGLKKKGMSQQSAYEQMFATCQTNASFNSMDNTLLTNFRQIMLNRWHTDDDAECVRNYKNSGNAGNGGGSSGTTDTRCITREEFADSVACQVLRNLGLPADSKTSSAQCDELIRREKKNGLCR